MLIMQEAAYVWGRGIWEISVPSAEYCCDPKTALRSKVYKKKKK
jgi:hypothetical protein